MKKFSNQFQFLAVLGLFAALFAVDAIAGGGGATQFGTLSTQLQGWAQGDLGIVIALAALIVGLAIGVVKQSMMAVVTGFGIALALYYGPQVIVGILNAAGGLSAAHLVAAAPIF